MYMQLCIVNNLVLNRRHCGYNFPGTASVRWRLMYNVFAYLDRYLALKCIFLQWFITAECILGPTSACTFSTMHNNIHFRFTLLVTLAFHSYWSRVFHPCKMRFPVPRFQSPPTNSLSFLQERMSQRRWTTKGCLSPARYIVVAVS